MTGWKPADLAAIADNRELRVTTHRRDRTLRPPTIVWHVVLDGNLYIRSVRGQDGAWYKAARRTGNGSIAVGGIQAEVTFTPDDTHSEAIDLAYRDKYGNGSPVRAITSPTATATTLRIDPR